MKDKRFLLVLENVEHIVRHDGDFFVRDFLNKLIGECENLTIMISSCEWIEFNAPIIPTFLDVFELDHVDSVKLFLD